MSDCNCIIVDDSEIDQLTLKAFLSRYPEFKILGTFSSPEKALEIINNLEIDVLFLDIQMPGISGLQLRKNALRIPACVFISYSQEYALESFELDALDYIVKPLRAERFDKTIQKIKNFLETKKLAETNLNENDDYFIKNGSEQIKINLKEVLYLEASSDYTTLNKKFDKHLISSSIGNLLKNKIFSDYLRVHRSYAVRKDTIYKIQRGKLILNDGTKIPIGKTYKDILLDSIRLD